MEAEAKTLNPIDVQVGQNLARIRVLRGMSQQVLGEACQDGLSAQQVSKYELGINQVSASRLVELATILRVQVMDLLEGLHELLPSLEITRKDVKTLQLHRSLPPEIQESLRTLMQAMTVAISNQMNVRKVLS